MSCEKEKLSDLPDEALNHHAANHKASIDALLCEPESFERGIDLMRHAGRVALIKTELVSFSRVSKHAGVGRENGSVKTKA
jgi:hypothetical protein